MRAICKAAVIFEEVQPLAITCVEGTEEQQKAAAEVMAANVRFKGPGDFGEGMLLRLFNSEHKTVRSSTAICFNHMWDRRGDGIQEYGDLITAFMNSQAFPDGVGYLVHALEQTTTRLPDVTYEICKRFLDLVGPAAADIRTKAAGDARSVIQVLVRLYSRALEERDTAVQTKCLNLLDQAAALGTFWLDEALAMYER